MGPELRRRRSRLALAKPAIGAFPAVEYLACIIAIVERAPGCPGQVQQGRLQPRRIFRLTHRPHPSPQRAGRMASRVEAEFDLPAARARRQPGWRRGRVVELQVFGAGGPLSGLKNVHMEPMRGCARRRIDGSTRAPRIDLSSAEPARADCRKISGAPGIGHVFARSLIAYFAPRPAAMGDDLWTRRASEFWPLRSAPQEERENSSSMRSQPGKSCR